ncbi:glycoside hydrolase family 53 protein [Mucilaginibacter sp.]
MQKFVCICAVFFCCLNLSCSKNKVSPTQPITTTIDTTFFKGADVSWATQMESSGYKFYDKNGNQQDIFNLMKSLGFNSIRLRAWVNPTNGWCNTKDVVAKAVRAKNAGLNVMIDFHYSDVWADPGDQNKPAAWVNLSFANLVTTVGTYTTGVMDTLKLNGVTPKWVQVGNETNDGMLWQDGRASTNMANFAALVTSGYNAVKAVSPSTKVIVHLSNGYDNSLFEWMFDGLKANGAKWDIIGMSLYPTISNYTTLDAQCLANMNDMVLRYGTPVMIVEVGIEEDQPTIAQAFLTDILQKTRSVPNKQGLGVFYWEPESYNSWQGYTLGAFDNTGKPTIALNAFAN